MRPPKQAGAGSIDLMKVCSTNRVFGNEDNIPAWLNLIYPQTNRLAQSAFCAVSDDGSPDSVAYGKAESTMRQTIRKGAHD